MSKLIISSICASLLLITGCTTQQHSMELGNSVTQMIAAQTLNPEAPALNGTENKSNLDGQIGENILSTYRSSTGEPESVQGAIEINIGN